jgi:crotonobetainyl-CoA:carnitine CoA-transferase CaiB-like acyl-CoA transferase
VQSVTQATLSRILATAVGDSQGSALIAAEADGKVDQSGSGSGTAGTKWQVRDGYVAMHLALGPAAGRFTNNLFAWLHEEGACDIELAELDWCMVPERDLLERARIAVAEFMSGKTKQEVLEASLERKLLAAPILTVADIAESAQLEARSFWVELGDNVLPGPFAHATADAFAFRRPAPRLGEHNAEVFGEILGLRV